MPNMRITTTLRSILLFLFLHLWDVYASSSARRDVPYVERALPVSIHPREHRERKIPYLSNTKAIIAQAVPQFRLTASVAVINVLVNSLRTDSSIPWPLRLPRLLWEMAIALLAHCSSMHHSPVFSMSLAFMTFSTALIDLFMWAPLFAAIASFQPCPKQWWSDHARTCTTNNDVRGHVLVMIQCMLTGFVYLMTSITAYAVVRAQRDEQHIERELVVQRHIEKQ